MIAESNSHNSILNGDEGNDTITANSKNNTLNGGAGNDLLKSYSTSSSSFSSNTLEGGTGNDHYVISRTSDVIIETSEDIGEIDTVSSFVNYTLGENLENLTLLFSANGIGNDDNNVLIGSTFNDLLDGGAGFGKDTISGGEGNDTLLGKWGNDNLFGETGNDSLNGGANVDQIDGGLGNDTLNGDSGNDSLTGGSNSDVLIGGFGNDILEGGDGGDRFQYATNTAFTTSGINAFNIDTISDFAVGTDKIVLSKRTFNKLTSVVGNGFTQPGDFATLTSDSGAATSTALIVYNTTNGKLFYNQNGALAGLGTGAQFATLTNNPGLSAGDFNIIA